MKKFSKYTLNTLTIINALILGINAVDGITIPYVGQITGVITAINGVISTYLLGSKRIDVVNSREDISTRLTDEQFKEIYGMEPLGDDINE